MYFLALPNSAPYGIPNAVTGFTSPLLASWQAKVARGEPVTPEEHNAIVLQLAWAKDVVGATPGTPFPHYGARDGSNDVLILGARAFEAGDLTFPAGAAGDAPIGTQSVDIRTTAGRRVVYDAAEWALRALELHPSMVVLPQGTAPAGLIPIAYAAVGGLILAGAGTAIYGLWRHDAGETERARIRENAHTARNVDVINGAVRVEVERLQASVRAGRDLAPNPNLTFPATQPASQRTGDGAREIDLSSLGWWLGGITALSVGIGAAAWVADRAWSRRQFLSAQRDTFTPPKAP